MDCEKPRETEISRGNYGEIFYIAQERGITCCVNLGVIRLQTREGTDKLKFHREQVSIKKGSRAQWQIAGKHPPLEAEEKLPAEETERKGGSLAG